MYDWKIEMESMREKLRDRGLILKDLKVLVGYLEREGRENGEERVIKVVIEGSFLN